MIGRNIRPQNSNSPNPSFRDTFLGEVSAHGTKASTLREGGQKGGGGAGGEKPRFIHLRGRRHASIPGAMFTTRESPTIHVRRTMTSPGGGRSSAKASQ